MSKNSIKVKDLSIDSIIVGTRRREDYGDMEAFAAKIGQRGYISPLGVDNNHKLAFGGRRLVACQMLGWKTVPCLFLGDLTERELREIELEENLERKDFTPYELAKMVVERADIEAEKVQEEFSVTVTQKGPGRPDTARKVAERTGMDRQKIERARRFDEAVKRFPELAKLSQRAALKEYAKRIAPPKTTRAKAEPAPKVVTLHEFQLSGAAYERMSTLVSMYGYTSQSGVIEAALELLLNTLEDAEMPEPAQPIPSPQPTVVQGGVFIHCDVCKKQMRRFDAKRSSKGVRGHSGCIKKAA